MGRGTEIRDTIANVLDMADITADAADPMCSIDLDDFSRIIIVYSVPQGAPPPIYRPELSTEPVTFSDPVTDTDTQLFTKVQTKRALSEASAEQSER